MKYLCFILLCFFGWFQCKPFIFNDSTQQLSYGGQKKSGSNEHYKIRMLANADCNKLRFNALWIKDSLVDMKCYSLTSDNQIKTTFNKKDTIIIDAYVHHDYQNEENPIKAAAKVKPPIDYKGEALLEYTYKGKVKYFVIDKFAILENVYYP